MQSSPMPWIHFSLLFFLLAASIFCNRTLVETTRQAKAAIRHRRLRRTHAEPIESYSWIGSGFPKLLPVETWPVKVLTEESVHYSLTDSEAYEEWLWTAPLVGDNHVRLGPDKRMFAIPMFHQLHCLRSMRSAIEGGLSSLDPVRQGHIHHCFNYLRQWTLCSADATLESGDFLTRNFTMERVGGTHTCVDWEPVYRMVEDNWYEFEQFRREHGLSGDQEDR